MKEDIIYYADKDNMLEYVSGNLDTQKTNKSQPEGAINEETGEINWDCPCLKSALEPPCGNFFKEAFSCFVSSKAEPKGSDCLEKFSAMQDCFRAHPEIYAANNNEDDAGSKDDIVDARQEIDTNKPQN